MSRRKEGEGEDDKRDGGGGGDGGGVAQGGGGAGSLSDIEQARLHRLLIEGAYPEHFRSRPDKTVTITYAVLDFPRTWLSEERLQTIIRGLVLPTFTNLLLGVVAVFIALLVTSTIIPEMFSPGTLHLLLSKPLSRSMIFLSRFFGGCFFVLINVSYLLFGLWLLLGWRFGIWNVGLLKCIPLFLFLFIVYYSVSALAGAYWKNAIVAVSVAGGLWGVCFVVGITKDMMKGFAQSASFRRVIVRDGLLMGVSEDDEVAIWGEEDGDWSEVFENGKPVHGPLLTQDGKTLVVTNGGDRGPRFARRMRSLSVAAGRENSGWSRESMANAPTDAAGIMLSDDDSLYVLGRTAIHRYQHPIGEKRPGLFGFDLPLPAIAAMAWKPVAKPAEGAAWKLPLDGDIQAQTHVIALYSRGTLIRLEPVATTTQDKGSEGEGEEDVEEGPSGLAYHETASLDLVDAVNLDADEGVMVRWYGDEVAIAVGDGRVLTIDGATWQVASAERPSLLTHPKFLAVSPDGQHMAVLQKNGGVLVSDEGEPLRSIGINGATAVSLTNDALWVSSPGRVVQRMDFASQETTTIAQPPLDNFQRVYRWIVTPLSTILPMPGELGRTSQYLLSGEETGDLGLVQGTLDAPYESIDPWTPVYRCSAFVVIILLLGCWHIERQEF